MKRILLCLIVCVFSTSIHAQGFLKKLTDRTADRILQKTEDKLVDELSEKLANQAVKPIDSFMDSLFVQSYESETGEKYDPENSSKMADAFSAMFGEVSLPDEYVFDFTMDIEVKDFGEKKANKMKIFVSTDKGYFGMEQNQDDKKMLMIFDAENEAMATYDFNRKECMAIPINSQLMATFGNMAIDNEIKDKNITIQKTGKTKKIIGYNSDHYFVDSDESESNVYISNDLPFTWEDSFGKIMSQFAPNFYKDNPEYDLKGMMLSAKTKRKSDNKKSEWKTKKIKEETVIITNSDFEQKSLGTN
ncbi:MAG: DUF4412 domain-containing protein [Saprospiraceae bacterium]|nr:DUF4412 domain-containing protein [Saprospiraceae bacterium]